MIFEVGPLGSMQSIGEVRPGMDVPVARPSNDFTSMGGKRYAQYGPRAQRSWVIDKTSVSPESVAFLQACADGSVVGDLYAYFEGWARTNLLPPRFGTPGIRGARDLLVRTSNGYGGTDTPTPVFGTVPVYGVPMRGARCSADPSFNDPSLMAWSEWMPVRGGKQYTFTAHGKKEEEVPYVVGQGIAELQVSVGDPDKSAKRTNLVVNPRAGNGWGQTPWGQVVSGATTAVGSTERVNTSLGVNTAHRQRLTAYAPASPFYVINNVNAWTASPGLMDVAPGDQVAMGGLVWQSAAGAMVAMVGFRDTAGAGLPYGPRSTYNDVPADPKGTGPGTWVSATAVAPAGAAKAFLVYGWFNNSHPDAKPVDALVAQNLIKNPSFEVNTTGWSADQGTLIRNTSNPPSTTWGGRVGSAIAQVTVTPGTSTTWFGMVQPTGDAPPVVEGQWVAARFWGAHDNSSASKMRLQAVLRGGVTAYRQSPAVSSPFYAGAFHEVVFQVPAGTTSVVLQAQVLANSGSPADGSRLWLDQVRLHVGATEAEVRAALARPYFDGSTPNTDTTRTVWDGAAHGSTSRELALGDWVQATAGILERGRSTPFTIEEYFDGTLDGEWTGDWQASASTIAASLSSVLARAETAALTSRGRATFTTPAGADRFRVRVRGAMEHSVTGLQVVEAAAPPSTYMPGEGPVRITVEDPTGSIEHVWSDRILHNRKVTIKEVG